MAAVEIVMVVAAVLLLVTLFIFLWQRLGWMNRDHSHAAPPHLDVPPPEHER